MGRVTVELDRTLYDRLGEHAERNGQTIIGTIRVAIVNHLDANDRLPIDYNHRLAAARVACRDLDKALGQMTVANRHLHLFEERA